MWSNRQAKVESAPFPIFVGGPCPSDGLLMVHGHEEWIYTEQEREQRRVAPGIYLGDATCIDRVTDAVSDEELRYRIVVNYAGWGPDQLEREMVAKAWYVTPADGELLFETPIQELWERLAPPSAPEFSVN